MAQCLDCDAEIPITDNAELGEIIGCPDCGTEFEVRSVNPVTIDRAPQEEEDWGE